MNIENMEKLLARLKSDQNPVEFDMTTWFRHGKDDLWNREEIVGIIETHVCNTTACLAGQAIALAVEEGFRPLGTVQDTATQWLELTKMEAYDLFHGRWLGWEENNEDEVENEPDLEVLTLDMAIVEVTRLIREERVK